MHGLQISIQFGATEQLNLGPVMYEEVCVYSNEPNSFGQ